MEHHVVIFGELELGALDQATFDAVLVSPLHHGTLPGWLGSPEEDSLTEKSAAAVLRDVAKRVRADRSLFARESVGTARTVRAIFPEAEAAYVARWLFATFRAAGAAGARGSLTAVAVGEGRACRMSVGTPSTISELDEAEAGALERSGDVRSIEAELAANSTRKETPRSKAKSYPPR